MGCIDREMQKHVKRGKKWRTGELVQRHERDVWTNRNESETKSERVGSVERDGQRHGKTELWRDVEAVKSQCTVRVTFIYSRVLTEWRGGEVKGGEML